MGGYLTLWNANDVLAYYGSLLGSITAIVVLVSTIQFTRKQIQRETYIKQQREKWDKVEDILSDALLKINPLQITYAITEASSDVDIGKLKTKIQLYKITSKQSLDLIRCYIDTNEIEAVGVFVNQIVSAIESFVSHADAYQTQYERMERIDRKYDAVFQAVNNHDADVILQDQKNRCIQELAKEQAEELIDICKQLECLATETATLYNGTYQMLLDQKRDIFRIIYKTIEGKAEKMLYWGYGKAR